MCLRSLVLLLFLVFFFFFFFFNDTATTEIYTLSLHDVFRSLPYDPERAFAPVGILGSGAADPDRSEEHTSELQSLTNLVCRLLLEKKKKKKKPTPTTNSRTSYL